MTTIHEEIKLNKVVNCSGKMTYLGSSLLAPEILTAMREAAGAYVHMDELNAKAGAFIAKACGAEDACVTAGAAAAIAIAVAACVTMGDPLLVEQVPNPKTRKRKVLIQKGHSISFGASLLQMIALGGGVVEEVGMVNKCLPYHLENAINEDTAAIIFVKSHHAVQTDLLAFEDVLRLAKKHKVPVIVDAAAEENLTCYYKSGADMVLYSGAKALGGPTSGFIAGSDKYIALCKKQSKGIARAMKVGKENILGLVKAVELYTRADNAKENSLKDQLHRVDAIVDGLKNIDGLTATKAKDVSGRAIYRARLAVDKSKLGMSALELDAKLREGAAPIYTRNHHADIGYFEADPRPMVDGDEELFINKVKSVLGKELR